MLWWPTVLVHSGLRSLLRCRTFSAKIRLFTVVGTELRANFGPSLYQLHALKLLNSMSLFALICKIRVKNTYLIGLLQRSKKCIYLGYLSLCSKYLVLSIFINVFAYSIVSLNNQIQNTKWSQKATWFNEEFYTTCTWETILILVLTFSLSL